MNLIDLETFVLVATEGSMTGAARRLDVPKSTVSRRVRRLEGALGLALVTRSPNRVRLTTHGELLRDRCAPALAMIGDAERELHGLASEPAGLLRLTTLKTLGQAAPLTQLLLEVRQRFPQVELEVVVTDHVLDFDEQRVDLALRPVTEGLPGDGRLVEHVLGRLHTGLYVSPHHHDPADLPDTLAGLASHVRVSHPLFVTKPLTFRSSSGREQRLELPDVELRTTSFEQVLQATLLGATVGVLPTFLARPDLDRGTLVRLLPEWRDRGALLGLVHPAGRPVLPKVSALIELFGERAVPSGLVAPA